MKKITTLILSLLTLLFLAGGYIIHYYTVRKMGMLRHIVYLNQKVEAQLPLSLLTGIVIALLIGLTVIVFCCFLKGKRRLNKGLLLMNATMIILSLFNILFIFFYSTSTVKSYYYISLMISIAALLHILNTAICNRMIQVNES